MEAYKQNAVASICSRMETLCQFPMQVIVSKGALLACGLSGREAVSPTDLIDQEQTREFPDFCRHLTAAKSGDRAVRRQIGEHGREAKAIIERMLLGAQTLSDGIKLLEKTFAPAELKILRQHKRYTPQMRAPTHHVLIRSIYRPGEIAVPQKLFGGCACGAIRYRCHTDPVLMLNRHCRDCQQASGSAYAAIVAVPEPAVQIRGKLHYYKIVGQTGKATERGFCPSCESPITVKSERRPGVLGLQAASLDDPSTYEPVMDVFISSAQPWDKMDPELQKHRRGYPDPKGLSRSLDLRSPSRTR